MNLAFSLSHGFQLKLDLHGLVRELDLARLGAIEHAGHQQGRDIGMHGLDIPVHAPC